MLKKSKACLYGGKRTPPTFQSVRRTAVQGGERFRVAGTDFKPERDRGLQGAKRIFLKQGKRGTAAKGMRDLILGRCRRGDGR